MENKSLKSVQKTENLTRQVFEQLKDQIITGKWQPGYKIPSENQLVDILNVSRITIREALQALVALDLLEKKRGQGTFVKNSFSESFFVSLLPLIQFDRSQAAYMHEYRKIVEAMGTEPGLYYHEKIIQAIEEKDRKKARNLMKKHLENNEKYLELFM